MKVLLVILVVLLAGCPNDAWESRVVSKGTLESNCDLNTYQGNHTLTCTEKRFFLVMYDGNGADDICYVNENEYNEVDVGTMYTCRLEKE